VTPAAKFWICKIAPGLIYEAMECLGGNGYVEENMLPRLYREAPVNAIWEGSGNVMCLDVLRALGQDAERDLFAALVREGCGGSADPLATLDPTKQAGARDLVSRLALCASATALKASAPPAVADAFITTRLRRPHAQLYGAVDFAPGLVELLLQRVLPD
jgi:putative acyl-CoA dehydrogenase